MTSYARVLTVVLSGACAASCASDLPSGSATGAQSSTSAGGASATSGGGYTGYHEPDAGPDADGGEGGGLTWSPVPWPSPCLVEIASDPKLAQAPLVWEACPGTEGCEKVVVNWPPGKITNPPMIGPTVLRIGDAYRVGALLELANDEARAVVYDTDGTAMAVWRVVECLAEMPRVHENGIWFGAQWTDPSTFFFAPYDSLAEGGTPIPGALSVQRRSSSDDLFAVQLTDGKTIAIHDRLNQKTSTFGPPVGLGNEGTWPSGDAVFFLHYPAFEEPEGWVWRRATNTFDPLLQPAPELIMDLKSDGETLVWIRTPPKTGGQWQSGDLWTSPYATTAAGLVPTKRRAVPVIADPNDGSVANAGYYAAGASDGLFHVYRLSDARHWSFALPADQWNPWQMSYVDEKAVWYQTARTVYRQSLASLGPGD